MSLKYYWVWVVAILAAAFATVRFVEPPYQALMLLSLVLTSQLVGILYLLRFVDAMEPFNVDSEMPGDMGVDPWALQEMLMEASGQAIARRPAVTNTSVLYGALMMEELGETFEALLPSLNYRGLYGETHKSRVNGRELWERFLIVSQDLKAEAKAIRAALEGQEFSMALTEEEAKPLFDGTTDVAVVNCGFALACGFDGAAGYAEVVGSNLSKRNPDTDQIDKTPDGKWVKGPNYREPNLGRVLRDTAYSRGEPDLLGYRRV